MSGKCKRCGQCCESVMITSSPKDIERDYQLWKQGKTKRPRADIDLIYPMLRYRRYSKKFKRYVYSCVHFSRTKSGLAKCGIQKIKPAMCSDFPYYGMSYQMNLEPQKVSQYKGCGYNEA